eukprot:GSChrysophyteH1.ASY1.ANO1.417.1 assembled CDS
MLHFVAALVLCSILVQKSPLVAGREVIVDVSAPWPRYKDSYSAEVSEFLAHENPHLFWNFVSQQCEEPSEHLSQTRSVNVAKSLLPVALHTLLDTVLGLSVYAPKVEFFRALAAEFQDPREENQLGGNLGGNPCDDRAWAVLYPGRQILCDVESLEAALIEPPSTRAPALVDLTFGLEDKDKTWDHAYSTQISNPSAYVVIYGTIGSPSFCTLHSSMLSKLTQRDAPSIGYSVRHAFPGQKQTERTNLQGFGVYLDIKNMEYMNIDDSDGSLEDHDENADAEGDADYAAGSASDATATADADTDTDTDTDTDELKLKKIKDLGVQAVYSILHSENPALRFSELVHSFPTHAARLSTIKSKATKRVTSHVRRWQMGAAQMIPSNALFINGAYVSLGANTFNVYDMLLTVRAEVDRLTHLRTFRNGSFALNAEQTSALKAAAMGLAVDDGDAEKHTARIDVSKGAKHVVSFVNNIERDPQYKRWPKHLSTLLQPSWQILQIRRNLYTIVAIPDVFTYDGALLVYQLNMIVNQQYPVRVGYVPSCSTDAGIKDVHSSNTDRAATSDDFCSLFVILRDKYSASAAVSFMAAIAESTLQREQNKMQAQNTLDEMVASSVNEAGSVADNTSEDVRRMQQVVADLKSIPIKELINFSYIYERGLRVNLWSLNGIVEKSLDMQQTLSQHLSREQYMLRQWYSSGKIKEKSKSMFTTILGLNRAYPRYHPLLEQTGGSVEYMDLALQQNTHTVSTDSDTFKDASFDSYPYHTSKELTLDQGATYFGTTILSLPATRSGFEALSAALRWIRSFNEREDSELDDNGDADDDGIPLPPQRLAFFFSSAQKRVLQSAEIPSDKILHDNMISALKEYAVSTSAGYNSEKHSETDIIVLHNGRKLVVPVSDTHNMQTKSNPVMSPFDFALLATVEHARLGSSLSEIMTSLMNRNEAVGALPELVDGIDAISTKFLHMNMFCGNYAAGNRRFNVKEALELGESDIVNKEQGAINLEFAVPPSVDSAASDLDSNEDSVEIVYVVDPLSEAGQRAAALLSLFRDQLRYHQTVVLAPRLNLAKEDFPLQNFYRYHTLTVRIDAPENWNIQSTVAQQDVDNLRTNNTPSTTTTIGYALKSILVAGSCFESPKLSPLDPFGLASIPPNGLQLTLRNVAGGGDVGNVHSDTLVMQNLGYYQLPAFSPGLYSLTLAEGRGSELFTIDGATELPGNISGKLFAVTSFSDRVNRLTVTKKPGFEAVPLLEDNDQESLGDKVTEVPEDDRIHVFSLATGHMYERLLRIMMLSVSKTTKLASAMSEKYGFEIGYVTYKWPMWLTQQTEKQRIIWGYKILFLDVLFPLDVKKVIYVDADQVVRADLKELWDLDLEGKPYAYTPFCTSREETLGFQFWRQGYWADHLQGRPYHISALYVVDLANFRYVTFPTSFFQYTNSSFRQ